MNTKIIFEFFMSKIVKRAGLYFKSASRVENFLKIVKRVGLFNRDLRVSVIKTSDNCVFSKADLQAIRLRIHSAINRQF